MNNERRKYASRRERLIRVIINEYRAIFTDGGVLLILLFAPLIYATIYSTAYAPEVVRRVPIGVIDNSRTSQSRQLISALDSGDRCSVAYQPCDMNEARTLLFERKIYGVVLIPDSYASDIEAGRQSVVSIYADASYFLFYRQVVEQAVLTIGNIGANIREVRLCDAGRGADFATNSAVGITETTHNLYNPSLGYGTFVMPAVLMVILQQTLLIGVCMIGGTRREHRIGYSEGVTSECEGGSAVILLFGKMVVYGSIYSLSSLYLLTLHYRLFGYPMNGATSDVVLFMALYITTCTLFAIAVSTLFRHRESALLLLLWSSIPILMLSGASFPREAIPRWLYNAGAIFPSSSGVEGIIRLQTMGATLRDVAPLIWRLIILALLFFVLAIFGLRRQLVGDWVKKEGDNP